MKPAELLRHYAPTQNHADRRAAFRAADFLDMAEGEGYDFGDPPVNTPDSPPRPDEVQRGPARGVPVEIPAGDLEIESVFHSSQQAGEGARGVRITHKPTGLKVERTVLSNRLQNTEAAMATLRARLATR